MKHKYRFERKIVKEIGKELSINENNGNIKNYYKKILFIRKKKK